MTNDPTEFTPPSDPHPLVIWEVWWTLPTGTKRIDEADTLRILAERVKHAAACAKGDVVIKRKI